jgi:hypothetical protein
MPEEQPDEADEVSLLDERRGADMVFAARQGNEKEVLKWLSEGVPVSYRDPNGWTALRWAACEGHEDVLALLLENGAHEDECGAAAEAGGGSSLHWAAYKGHVRLVWRLLTCKPPLSAKALDMEGNTPLHLASASGHLLILQTLLSKGVDVSLTNAYGNTASQVSTSPDCKALLKKAASAALEGRPYLCSCSGSFHSESDSSPFDVIDKVSVSIVRPVRYSTECSKLISQAEAQLQGAMSAYQASSAGHKDVEKLDDAIKGAEQIGASLPEINKAFAELERLRAQIALTEAVTALQEARPLKNAEARENFAMLRTLAAPIEQAKAKGVAQASIDGAEALRQTVDAEIVLYDLILSAAGLKMMPSEELEEGASEAPPSADDGFAKRAEAGITRLAGAIHQAQALEGMVEVVEAGETEVRDHSRRARRYTRTPIPRDMPQHAGTGPRSTPRERAAAAA